MSLCRVEDIFTKCWNKQLKRLCISFDEEDCWSIQGNEYILKEIQDEIKNLIQSKRILEHMKPVKVVPETDCTCPKELDMSQAPPPNFTWFGRFDCPEHGICGTKCNFPQICKHMDKICPVHGKEQPYCDICDENILKMQKELSKLTEESRQEAIRHTMEIIEKCKQNPKPKPIEKLKEGSNISDRVKKIEELIQLTNWLLNARINGL